MIDVVDHRLLEEKPHCEALLEDRSALEFRRLSAKGKRTTLRLEDQGRPWNACVNSACYTVEGRWYCGRHAGSELLRMMAKKET